MLLAEIVHAPLPVQDLNLASHIVFSQTTVERKFDVVRKVIVMRCANWLGQPAHTYKHKAAEFVVKAFNGIADLAKKDTWIRNTAAHGNIYRGPPPRLIPSPFDFEGVQRHHNKRGVKGAVGLDMKSGFTAEELRTFATAVRGTQTLFLPLKDPIQMIMFDQVTPALEGALVELGRGLKLQPPLQDRPHRKARPQRAPR
jgi:hypothetical protein